MKLTVLTDNNVLQSKNFLGEHGLSLYIEEEDKKILFDTGYSDVFLRNAFKMGINLSNLDHIVLSHGHYDHTWGLSSYLQFYTSSLKQKLPVNIPVILTHPLTFNQKFDDELGEVGSMLSKETLSKSFEIKLTKEPYWITEKLVFLGEIPRNNDFEGKDSLSKISINDKLQDDYIIEDSALVYKSDQGLIIITGCSHSGICNIVSYAREICRQSSVTDIIGGFHLIKPSAERLSKTVNFLKESKIKNIYPCHCTDLISKISLSKSLSLKETGIGLKLEYT